MTREQLLARPVPGKWSTQEVVCHLADYEPIYADPSPLPWKASSTAKATSAVVPFRAW
jgi:hypothetical protein